MNSRIIRQHQIEKIVFYFYEEFGVSVKSILINKKLLGNYCSSFSDNLSIILRGKMLRNKCTIRLTKYIIS